MLFCQHQTLYNILYVNAKSNILSICKHTHICINVNQTWYILYCLWEMQQPQKNDPNEFKLSKCADQCTTNNVLCFHTDGTHKPSSDISYTTQSVHEAAFSSRGILPRPGMVLRQWWVDGIFWYRTVVNRYKRAVYHNNGLIVILLTLPWRAVTLHLQCWVDFGMLHQQLAIVFRRMD